MITGTLYVVATPIGNMEDMTFRAVRTLKEVDLILCEDTRTTGKLLERYDIKNKTMSYHAHSSSGKEDAIIRMLEDGKNIALVSDAGTPCISDPGVLLVDRVRKTFENDAKIITIPGASALLSALSVSGISAANFMFLGFLPHKKGRETIFKQIAETTYTIAFYESPHRIMKTLASLREVLPVDRQVVIARELTKQFEETVRGTPEEILEFFTQNPEKERGEFVVIVGA